MKHVVITGVSRGLGRAMALGFAADGWSVSGCGTDAAALQLLARGPSTSVSDPAHYCIPDTLLKFVFSSAAESIPSPH